jgi:hypothetical protein
MEVARIYYTREFLAHKLQKNLQFSPLRDFDMTLM